MGLAPLAWVMGYQADPASKAALAHVAWASSSQCGV